MVEVRKELWGSFGPSRGTVSTQSPFLLPIYLLIPRPVIEADFLASN